MAQEGGRAGELDPRPRPAHVERRRWQADGIAYDQTDNFFVVEVASRCPVSALGRTETEEATVLSDGWFSAADLQRLRASGGRYEPDALPVLLSGWSDLGSEPRP